MVQTSPAWDSQLSDVNQESNHILGWAPCLSAQAGAAVHREGQDINGNL